MFIGVAGFAWGVVALPVVVAPAHAGAGPPGVTFYANSPIMQKFVHSLPGLGAANANDLGQYIPVAVPDTTTYPGSDYYEIGLTDYTQQLHRDLPKATKLRGYYQINGPDTNAKYLGPVILGRRYNPANPPGVAGNGKPVRIKFTNNLGVGAAGNLFLPVDETIMGAGMGPPVPDPGGPSETYKQNRATIHLHGGFTPWISDGTPHQWITPATETTLYPKGVSFQNVPDMVGAGPGQVPGTPTDGMGTFYYPNQQSSRLMFYHDHSYGITRLNVYAGEAAGYLLVDQFEDDLIDGTNVTGINPTLAKVLPNQGGGIYKYGIPLIIQDKTFVPVDVDIQDSKWNVWRTAQGITDGLPGDLWFPHVYEPNQDPTAPDGMNPTGRWDYGPWFWPVFPAIGPLPEVSHVPEAFKDTMLVNGTPYPYLNVEPKAYRFRILNACNDRFLNLQLYKAYRGTEVKMVKAVATKKFPPLWPTDNRDGGVPDPKTAGPPMIQIGSEGGFLPAPAVIPPQPVNYEYDRRNIVVLNVKEKALFLGPAERADVIIDFSRYNGKTLVLYNDAPAPVPASDPRQDYYTGNPDLTASGGAPSTKARFGPNTRTIMIFKVRGKRSRVPFDKAALNTAITAAYVNSQPPPIVPQTTYPPPWQAAADSYARIQDNTLTYTPVGGGAPVTRDLQPKALHELFDDYGRMNSVLALERKFTTAFNQTTLPFKYIDQPDEVFNAGETQLWKITHNGVDTHAIHFHLFNVQVINRVGWDGQIRPPDPNEQGWKETVRMNPLEDIIIAMKADLPTVPFAVPVSMRPLDPTSALGTTTQFTRFGPDGNPRVTVNAITNFGHEFVWHCHLLGHEENDMMRPLVVMPGP